jgi:hypothetical protein
MSDVPSNLIPTRVTSLPDAPVASADGLLLYVYQGNNYKVRAGDLLEVAGVPLTRQVIAGTGMTGGGALSSNVTLSVAQGGITTPLLEATGVTPATYGNGLNIPTFAVDVSGRITSASSVPLTVSGFEGVWNASTNTPTLTSSSGAKGHYYVVSVAGNTSLNGVTGWLVGDWAVFDGVVWQKIASASAVSSVNGHTGIVNLTYADLAGGIPTWNQNTTGYASALKSATTTVDVSAASAPTSGQVLTASGSAAATWQTPAVPVTSFSAGTTGLMPSTGSTGAVVLSGLLAGASGGTGVVNTGKTITLGGNLVTSGAFTTTLTSTATTAVTLPTSGNLLSSVTAVGAVSGTPSSTTYLRGDGTWATTGTVTSVAMTVPAFLSVSGSPVTGSGTLAVTLSGTALPIANGGTNSTATATAGGAAYGTGTAYALTAAGTAGQVLTSAGASAPTWSGISGGTF